LSLAVRKGQRPPWICLGRAVGPDRAAAAGSAAAGWSPWPQAAGWPQGAVRHLVCPGVACGSSHFA